MAPSISNTKATAPRKSTKMKNDLPTIRVTRVSKIPKAKSKSTAGEIPSRITRETTQRVVIASKLFHDVINRNDPIDRLTDDCLDVFFSLTPVVDLIKMRSVSRLWRDSIDWRLGNFYFQRKYFPEFAATEPSPRATISALFSRDELSRAFRRNVYLNTMRTKSIATSIKRFTKIFYHSLWYYRSWAICGDYFVWMGEDHLNIQRIFNVGDDEIQPIRSYRLIDKYFTSLNFSNTQQAIRPESCGVGSEGEPLLALMVYQRSTDNYPAWKLGGNCRQCGYWGTLVVSRNTTRCVTDLCYYHPATVRIKC
ncbi:hypothetical protein DFP73DRAFT_314559 [Morchella snyderi]|nr:hypothetical protein DFP73DRAFT_314559 [Morchella snyderi]